MEDLLDPTKYNYIFDDLVQVRIQAYNSYGWGPLSSTPLTSGGRVRTVPS